MNIQRSLVRLYPHTWRERYEEEVLAMLEQRSLSFTDGVNLFFGALDAQLHPHLGTTGMALYERTLAMFLTLRRSLLTIFCAFIGFVLAGWTFQKMTEYDDFVAVARTHSVVGLSFNLVVIGAVVALLAILVGGLPIVMAVIRSALAHKRRGPLLLLTVPFLTFVVLLGTIRLLEALHRPGSQLSPVLDRGLFFGTLLAVAIASAGAVCFAVARSEVSEKLLRVAVLPSILATLSMVLVLAATIIWGFGLRDAAPQLFAGNDGIVGSSTTGTWLAIVIAMAIATALSTVSLLRGLSARSALCNAAA